jgi:hypothetical protein
MGNMYGAWRDEPRKQLGPQMGGKRLLWGKRGNPRAIKKEVKKI